MEDLVAVLATAVLAGTLAGAAFFFVGRRIERKAAEQAGKAGEQQAAKFLSDARREADAARSEAALQGREEVMRAREEWSKEQARLREEIERQEDRVAEREAQIERRGDEMGRLESRLDEQRSDIEALRDKLEADRVEIEKIKEEQTKRLEQIAGLSAAQARSELMASLEESARSEAAAQIREIKEEATRTADREARKIVSLAIQRIAAERSVEESVSAVALPSDEMKGRIIGREGRNIRAFETATGVDVIIDDTPDTVVVSCFDPVRREIGRLALEQLITDGRIHPGRIEEVVQKAREQVEQQILEAGEQAVYELGIHGMPIDLVKVVGRMKYRTSYGQNILNHSIEVAWIAAAMAAELKLDVALAKRGALLHDIGKALTHQHEGTHVELGVELAQKHGEHPVVINCIAAHHGDVPHESPISVIVQAADAASGARPGARREAIETYVKRLTRLEELASEFEGVEKTYAIQAGRELRIVVTPDQITDTEASDLSARIARRIESEVQYPGQIKVVVIRETRAVDFAR